MVTILVFISDHGCHYWKTISDHDSVKHYSLCTLAQGVIMFLLFLRLEGKVRAFLCG